MVGTVAMFAAEQTNLCLKIGVQGVENISCAYTVCTYYGTKKLINR